MGTLRRMLEHLGLWGAPQILTGKPGEANRKVFNQTRTYARRYKTKPRFTISGNIATLHLSKCQYQITPKGWRRINAPTEKEVA